MRLDHITPKQSGRPEGSAQRVRSKPTEPKIRLNRKATETQTSHARFGMAPQGDVPTELLDDHRALEPPDPIPNSAVKRRIADGSVGFPHARVGHRQAPIANPRASHGSGVFAIGPAFGHRLTLLIPPCQDLMRKDLIDPPSNTKTHQCCALDSFLEPATMMWPDATVESLSRPGYS